VFAWTKGEAVILEVALLNVREEMCNEFEAAFKQAECIISSMPGYVSHEFHKCIEVPTRYILLVRWKTLKDHTVGFRQSDEYQEWKRLLHHFYDPFPTVEHFELVTSYLA
jgi:heme-degrading monooxygenase HmoA